MRILVALTTSTLVACAPAAPLSIAFADDRLPADGTSTTTITATLGAPVEGAVVQWTATGGLLSSSATRIEDGASTVVLTAILERELGAASTRTIDVTARVVLAENRALDAAGTIELDAPTEGPPLVVVTADPPAADADGASEVRLVVQTRRLGDGAQLQVTTTAGALSAERIAADDGAVLTAPSDAQEAIVVVRDPDSGAEASTHVLFVRPGDPRFDLTGTFVQIGPARVRLTSGTLQPNPQCVVAPSYVKVDFVQTGLDLHATYTTCAVTFPPVTSIAGTVTNEGGPGFYAAVPVVESDLTLPSGDLGAEYEPPTSVVVAGAVLDDPATDALPTDEADPRVQDADGDGEPGVTVENSLGGEQHIVYRNTGTSRGVVVSSNRIEGARAGDLLAVTETSVFGVGGAFLPAVEGLPSVVEVVRVDGLHGAADADTDEDGALTCDEIAGLAPSLATLTPPDTPFDCGGIE